MIPICFGVGNRVVQSLRRVEHGSIGGAASSCRSFPSSPNAGRAGVAGTCEGVLATASTGALRDHRTAPNRPDIAGSPVRPETPGSGGDRRRARSGIAFAVLNVAGLVPLGELLGSFGDSDATFVDYFAKDSNSNGAVVGGIVLALSTLTFLWFLSNLRLSVDSTGPLPGVITAAGTTFVVLLMSGTAALVTVPYARTFGGAFDEESVLVGSDALLPQLGYVLVAVFAMWAAAVLILAATLAARAHSSFPRWLVRLGFAASAFVFLLGPSVMGVLGVPAWALAVSIHWLRGGGASGAVRREHR